MHQVHSSKRPKNERWNKDLSEGLLAGIYAASQGLMNAFRHEFVTTKIVMTYDNLPVSRGPYKCTAHYTALTKPSYTARAL